METPVLKAATCLAIIVLALGLTGVTVGAQETPDPLVWTNYEPVLFPVVVKNLHGTNGTVWTSETLARNTSSEPRLFAVGLLNTGIPVNHVIKPGEIRSGAVSNVVPIDGSLMWIQKGRADDYSFSCRLSETSRPENGDGIDLPVITLEESYSRAFELLKVPVTGEHRLMLRVYDLWSIPGGEVEVELHDLEFGTKDNTLIGTFRLSLWGAPSSPTQLSMRVGFVRLRLDEHLPADGSDLRIVVRPLTKGQRLWAMVSLTHNQTQRVSIVTPQ